MKRYYVGFGVLALNLMLFNGTAFSAADDYDPVSGEPKCTNCHTPDRRYSTDYTRDETCAECHGPGLSDKYVEIDGRFRAPDGAKEVNEYVAANEKKAAPKKETSAKGMALIPAGEFTMGSNEWWPKSQPEHQRMVEAFYLDGYEVTNQRYKAFVDATGYPAPDHWKEGKIPQGKGDHPVVYVTWTDADAFCRWEGKRLPSEAEWEKASRGKDKRTFPWGDKFSKDRGNTPQLGHEDTMPVGSFENGKSPYGIYDMAGNAFEWTDSWFKPYPGNTHSDENYGEKYKVLKGGSWYDCTTYKCGISAPNYNRIFFHPSTKNNNFGFRCAKDK
ncbi:MAG: formylglycine-generating enzyme family protein [Deltaproteobacteria bacterium]|nr:formylglycine-generating enzyme family protein [Deltaproteobacteria bacterium]